MKLELKKNLIVAEIPFIDEANFGEAFYNDHIWVDENPYGIVNRYQQLFSVNAGIGIVEDHLIGQFILRLTGGLYSHFLEKELVLLLGDVPLQ